MITLLQQTARFLFTTLPGTILVAVVGVFFLIGSFASMFSKPEVAEKMAIADLENRSEAPKARYLELTGAHIVWHELRTLTTKRTKKGGEVTSETTKMYYVPVASKESVARLAKDGPKGLWSDKNVRAWLKVSPDELEKGLPAEAAGLKDPKPEWVLKEHSLAVDWHALSSEDQAVRDGLTKAAEGQAADKVLVLRYDVRPPTKGAMVSGGICMLFFSGLLFVPLAVCLARRKREARSGLAEPPAGGARGAFDQAVRGAVEQAVRGAMAQPPMAVPVAPEPQYWYLRGGERHGPVPLSRLRSLQKSGELAGGDLICPVGGQEWARADTLAGLQTA